MVIVLRAVSPKVCIATVMVTYRSSTNTIPYRTCNVRHAGGFNGGVAVLAIVSIIAKTYVFRMHFGNSHSVRIYSAVYSEYPDWYGQTRAT